MSWGGPFWECRQNQSHVSLVINTAIKFPRREWKRTISGAIPPQKDMSFCEKLLNFFCVTYEFDPRFLTYGTA